MNSAAVAQIPKIDYTTTPHPSGVKALSLKDAPALIESLLPVQKLSIESYREQMSLRSKFLAPMASYWKGRKPLVLNRACVLASLLPVTANPIKDLAVFELLMGMDDVSMSKRIGLAKPVEIVRHVAVHDIGAFFKVTPPDQADSLPNQGPFDIEGYAYLKNGIERVPKLSWREDVSEDKKHELAAGLFGTQSHKELAGAKGTSRAEEIADKVSTHIWPTVNAHLGTKASSFPELVEQLGVMRYGHRPTVGDTFSGSGQIPFAAAQLGCDVYASDLNPVSCLLTWGAFNIVGASAEKRKEIEKEQETIVATVREEIDALGIETDGKGWRGKVYLYCLEVTCPSSGWKVPVLTTMVVSKGKSVFAKLVPDAANKRYDIQLVINATTAQMNAAEKGTYLKGNVIHIVNGREHINSIGSIRGDFNEVVNGKRVKKNELRLWDKSDVVFRDDDIYNERLYAIQWIEDNDSTRPATEFRAVTKADLVREAEVTKFVQDNLSKWQEEGWVPDTRIEPGEKTDEPIRTRGWTYWHHLFNPRQLLTAMLFSRNKKPAFQVGLTQQLNWNSRLSHWNFAMTAVAQVFYNQALNTFPTYGCRGFYDAEERFAPKLRSSPLSTEFIIDNIPANSLIHPLDIGITDPPYGDAVKEILHNSS